MLVTRNPTSNTTPDPAQGGLAVTGNINTGHGATTAAAATGTQSKTCIWTGFPLVAGQLKSITLKFDWSEDGLVNIGTGSATNAFIVQYSLNGGGVWNSAFTHADVVSPNSGSSSIVISPPQNTSQIQVRDKMTATATADLSDNASITASISNIRIEVVTSDAPPVIII